MAAVVEVRDLRKRYRARDPWAVDGVTFSLEPGRAFGLLGPNGAGKSTVVKTFLANLQRADDSGASLGYVSAIALEERQVLAYNSGNPTGDPALGGRGSWLGFLHPGEGEQRDEHDGKSRGYGKGPEVGRAPAHGCIFLGTCLSVSLIAVSNFARPGSSDVVELRGYDLSVDRLAPRRTRNPSARRHRRHPRAGTNPLDAGGDALVARWR